MFHNPMFSTFIPMQFLQFFLFLYFATLHSKGALKVGGKVSRMFTLSQIEHDLPMPPHLMSRPILDAIKAELERLFLDKVSFRSVMFKPFNGEVLVGRISGYDDKGLQVSLYFFNDICIPGHMMQYGTVRGLDGRWMLKTEDGDELYLDLDDEIRFLVPSTKYPPIPIEQKQDDPPYAPMQIVGSIKGDGLGLLAWWKADEEGEETAEQ